MMAPSSWVDVVPHCRHPTSIILAIFNLLGLLAAVACAAQYVGPGRGRPAASQSTAVGVDRVRGSYSLPDAGR